MSLPDEITDSIISRLRGRALKAYTERPQAVRDVIRNRTYSFVHEMSRFLTENPGLNDGPAYYELISADIEAAFAATT